MLVASFSLIGIPSSDTADAVLPDFNFSAAGDWGCLTTTTDVVNNILNKDTELSLGLGDYSYEPTADCWLDIISPLDSQMKIAIGNHDVESQALLQEYMDHCGLNQQFYSFDYQNVHFLAMSTEVQLGPGSAQHTFVTSDLASAACNDSIKWIVVFLHKPAYASIGTVHPGVLTILRDVYHPIFEQFGVDLVIQAHNHNYERSYPITYNPIQPENPTITDASTSSYNNPSGQIFVVAGTGGNFLYGFENQEPYVITQAVAHGFFNVDIVDDGLTMSGTFYANDGTIRDQFTITKTVDSSACPSPPAGYTHDPPLSLTGSNYYDVPSSGSLQLTQFTVATWFRTSINYGSSAYIVTKGGFGSEAAGSNNNYGIWMTSSERIRAGFETQSGPDHHATSPGIYNDGQWHYAVVTYGSSTIRLYIDGIQVATSATSGAIPDNTGTQPLRIGANSLSPNGFFTGNADEVRVWNRVLSAGEIASQYNEGTFDTTGQIIHLPF
jgi:hypothetical protein